MIIELQNLGKRYNRNWIFRHLNHTFHSGKSYAITGANGSGKSTLLQVVAGAITLSEGQIVMATDEQRPPPNYLNSTPVVLDPKLAITVEQHHRHLSIAAPYLELIEEMTLTEFLQFHFQFKQIIPGQTISSIIEFIQLKKAAHQQIRHYSSGMKQRVKLAQAIFSNMPIILLDEPTTNLDTNGIDLYYQLIELFCLHRLLIICSNSEPEIRFCKERLCIEDFVK